MMLRFLPTILLIFFTQFPSSLGAAISRHDIQIQRSYPSRRDLISLDTVQMPEGCFAMTSDQQLFSIPGVLDKLISLGTFLRKDHDEVSP
ncbi:hypothetical protein DL96DRAFT_1631734 [Flagelloscypha sp. PMI_526]|nr:hypothetical protein DL96DRAFT_1631734 [Flagelloscypha sp. PMI_526]